MIDAVGMEAHGSASPRRPSRRDGAAARRSGEKLMEPPGWTGSPRCSWRSSSRRGGTISLIGVYGGMTDPLPMMVMFDKQIQLRMGQANVKRWIDDLLPLVVEDDGGAASRNWPAAPPTAMRRTRIMPKDDDDGGDQPGPEPPAGTIRSLAPLGGSEERQKPNRQWVTKGVATTVPGRAVPRTSTVTRVPVPTDGGEAQADAVAEDG